MTCKHALLIRVIESLIRLYCMFFVAAKVKAEAAAAAKKAQEEGKFAVSSS